MGTRKEAHKQQHNMGENIISVAQCPEIHVGLAIFFVQTIITSQVKKKDQGQHACGPRRKANICG